jgi:hypothetical protein
MSSTRNYRVSGFSFSLERCKNDPRIQNRFELQDTVARCVRRWSTYVED